MLCLVISRFGPEWRFSLSEPLSYHSIQPRSSWPSLRMTTIGVFAVICLRLLYSSAFVCSGGDCLRRTLRDGKSFFSSFISGRISLRLAMSAFGSRSNLGRYRRQRRRGAALGVPGLVLIVFVRQTAEQPAALAGDLRRVE